MMRTQPFARAAAMFALIQAAFGMPTVRERHAALAGIGPYKSRGKGGKRARHPSRHFRGAGQARRPQGQALVIRNVVFIVIALICGFSLALASLEQRQKRQQEDARRIAVEEACRTIVEAGLVRSCGQVK